MSRMCWTKIFAFRVFLLTQLLKHWHVKGRQTPHNKKRQSDVPYWCISLPRSGWEFCSNQSQALCETTNQKHYPDLGSEIHQYGISALVSQMSFRGRNHDGFAKCRLFSPGGIYNLLFLESCQFSRFKNKAFNRETVKCLLLRLYKPTTIKRAIPGIPRLSFDLHM